MLVMTTITNVFFGWRAQISIWFLWCCWSLPPGKIGSRWFGSHHELRVAQKEMVVVHGPGGVVAGVRGQRQRGSPSFSAVARLATRSALRNCPAPRRQCERVCPLAVVQLHGTPSFLQGRQLQPFALKRQPQTTGLPCKALVNLFFVSTFF